MRFFSLLLSGVILFGCVQENSGYKILGIGTSIQSNSTPGANPEPKGGEFPDAAIQCLDSLELFERTVRPKIEACTGCHNALAPAAGLALENNKNEVLCKNLRNAGILDFGNPRESDFLKKGLGEDPHGGGAILNQEDIFDIVNWIQKEAKPEEENLFVIENFSLGGDVFPAGEGTSVDFNGNLYAVGFQESPIRQIAQIDPRTATATRFYGAFNNEDALGAAGTRVTLDNHLVFVSLEKFLVYIDLNTPTPQLIRRVSIGASSLNDLAISPKGIVYITDPEGFTGDSKSMIWMYNPANNESMALELSEDPNDPLHITAALNGIDVSPDGSTLYVNSYNGQGQGNRIYSYTINTDGTIDPKSRQIFIDLDLKLEGEICGSDGMRFDRIMNSDSLIKGNIWLACTIRGFGRILQISPEGEIVRQIQTPLDQVRNLAFGGPDGRTLYAIGLRPNERFGNIVQIRVEHPGNAWVQKEVKKIEVSP